MSAQASESKEPAPFTRDQELWQYKHELSQRIRHPLVELNNLMEEAAKRGVSVNLRAENVNIGLGYDPVPFIDLSVFDPA
jgi:hypothetical protein